MSERQVRAQQLEAAASTRIVMLDGAMGTTIQQLGLSEEDFRGELLTDHNTDVKGNNDLLSLTRPDTIRGIHDAFLEAGADIVTTNTFNATVMSQADYGTEHLVREMNTAAAQLASQAACAVETPERPRFAAGALGPTSKTASISPDVADPGYRAVTFDDLREGYLEAAAALVEGGVDLLVLETVFDTLNAKAAIFALEELFAELAELSRVADTRVSAYPNAGLPNEFGEYDETPEQTAALLAEWAETGLVNILGGCCGTTPEHIRAIAEAVAGTAPREIPAAPRNLRLSGLEPLEIRA